MKEIILIAAMAENRVIGRDNAMPFTVKGNLSRFKEMTMGWPCIMGRKTWDSLPKKPLPGRLNIIISKTINPRDFTRRHIEPSICDAENNEEFINVKFFDSISDAIEFCSSYEKIFICGGESIYRQALPLANRIDLTLVPGQYEGDAFFPEIDDNWKISDTVSYNDFSVVNYIKINQE